MWTDAEKAIYTDPSGRKHDPLALDRRLRAATGGQLADWLDHAAAGDPQPDRPPPPPDTVAVAAAAEANLIRAARVAFGLTADDPEAAGYVGEWRVLDHLYDFLRHLSGEGKPAATSPTSPPATDLASSASTTKPPCGCT